MEYGAESRPQICHESGTNGGLLPNCKPTPLAADNVHQRVSHRTEAATQITRELLNAESRDRLQNPVVRPAVVFVEELNVIFGHGDGRHFRLRNLTLPRAFAKGRHAVVSGTLVIVPESRGIRKLRSVVDWYRQTRISSVPDRTFTRWIPLKGFTYSS